MSRLTENKIVVITRKTRLDELVARFNTLDQARFYVEHLGADFSDYQREDFQYKAALAEVESQLQAVGRVQVVERTYVPNFIFGAEDTVVVIGQDGLVANTIKYMEGKPVVGVNPDPERWDGVLLPFAFRDVGKVVREVFRGGRPVKEITLAQAELNNGQKMYAVNDLFIGPRSHTSARYILEAGGGREVQSSSGIIVSTGLGSTGWFKSIVAGTRKLERLLRSLGIGPAGEPEFYPVEINEGGDGRFDWSADYLYFSVREPFPSRTTGTDLVMGRVDDRAGLAVTSLMAAGGVIFSDGIENDFLEFNSGQKAVISVADRKGRLVV